MKQKDLALIIVIAFIGAIASLFISKIIFVSPKDRQQQVEVVQAITTNFPAPSPVYFNSSSIDPTKLITIGQNANSNPF
jgi:hypothetical protein